LLTLRDGAELRYKIWEAASRSCPAMIAAKLIKGAKLKVYPGAPHATATTHADELNADLLAILKA